MGVFDSLFGRKRDVKEELIRELAALRIRSDPAAAVLGYDEAMLQGLSKEKIFALPEATIVVITESFVVLRRQGMSATKAIEAIERFRAETSDHPLAPLPKSLFDFVAGRVHLEHASGAPLDEDFIDNAVHTSASVFGLEIEMPDRPPYIIHMRADVDRYDVVLASYKRREGGFLFPWRLLAFEKASGNFAFSYNLEITPVSCCLGSHQSGGTHLNFGEANPNMTRKAFEEWAAPKLLKHIYGDALMGLDEAHAVAVRSVANLLQQEGCSIDAMEEASGVDPQILATRPNGTHLIIIVRADVFPEKPAATDYKNPTEAILAHGFEGEVMFAGVMMGNANGRNGIEQMAVLRDSKYSIWFDGLVRF